MKRLLLILLLLPACNEADAWNIVTGAGSGVIVAAGTTPCETAGCSGSYMFCWTGDYTADTDKACFTSGSATKDGTQTGTVEIDAAYGRSGNGIRINAQDESWAWDITGNDGLEDALGTVWMSVYTPDLSTEINFFEAYSDGNDDGIEFSLGASERTIASNRANDASDQVTTPVTTGAVDQGEWTRIMYSWDITGDKHKLCVDKDTGGDKDAGECQEDTGDTLVAWGVNPSKILLGELYFGNAPAESVYVDDVKILSTYDASDPNPL